jgi:hypothetical protein
MSLPDFTAEGDLPVGIHQATVIEVTQRFGSSIGTRDLCTRRLTHVHELARRTGFLKHFVIFGSYVTAKNEPNDVDIVLIMDDTFRLEQAPFESRGLFDHATAQARYGASIFWIRPGLIIGETVEEFITYWQVKRDGSKRGIVKVIP